MSQWGEIAALLPYRPSLARLSTDLGHVPCSPGPSRGTGDGEPGVLPLTSWQCSAPPDHRTQAFRTLRRATYQARTQASSRQATPAQLRWAATLQLFSRHEPKAVEKAHAWLRRGLASAADPAPFLTDLGALYLILAEDTGKTRYLLQSIEASDRALEKAPDAAAPRYNLALALTQLGLADSAREQWDRFLDREPRGPWAEEAKRWRRALPTDGRDWRKNVLTRIEAAITQGGDPSLGVTPDQHQPIREWIESELLPRWAEAWLAGDREAASRTLTAAGRLATHLAHTADDRLLAETMAAIARATPEQRSRWARGHRAYGEGWRRLSAKDYRGALAQFEQAGRELGKASPFRPWAQFQSALALYYLKQPELSESQLKELAGSIERKGSTALAGRILWIRGLNASSSGLVESSNGQYRAAAALFRDLGEDQNLAATQGLLAAGLTKLGHSETAWTLTRSALARRPRIFGLLRLQAVLQDATNNAQRQGLPRAGLYFANELVAVAAAEGSPEIRHNALLRRAALYSDLGLGLEACADLQAAAKVLALTPDPRSFPGETADREYEWARTCLPKDPAEAVRALTRALRFYEMSGNRQRLPQAYRLRARYHLAQGRLDDAERDLERATALLTEALFSTRPSPLRQDQVIALRESLDAMVEFQAVVRHDADRAFHFAEQQRHWALWEWARVAAPQASGASFLARPREIASWTDLRALRRGDTAVLAYHSLPDRVLLWIHGPAGTAFHSLPLGRDVLRSQLSWLRSAAQRGNRAVLRSAGGALYESLFAPAAASITGASRLVVVPDRLLQDLPFGLLYDPGSERYLYERHPLVFAPSATAYARLHSLAERSELGIHRLLAVAATHGSKPALDLLPETGKEAQGVAEPWQGRALSFQEAAPLLRELERADAFHFAGHALLDADTLRLVLHDDAEHPLQLTAAEILGSGLPHLRLVTLSGCRTVDLGASGQVGSSSAGFVRSFLAGGAVTVVASFLDLPDSPAGKVFPAFYRRLAEGEDPATALQRACMEQPAEVRTPLCGSLAVYGVSLPFAAKK